MSILSHGVCGRNQWRGPVREVALNPLATGRTGRRQVTHGKKAAALGRKRATNERRNGKSPSSVGRAEFHFLALDEAGTERCWINEDMVRVRLRGDTCTDDSETNGRDVLRGPRR